MGKIKGYDQLLAKQLFMRISKIYGVGLEKFCTEYVDRLKPHIQLVEHINDNRTEDIDIYLQREFSKENR